MWNCLEKSIFVNKNLISIVKLLTLEGYYLMNLRFTR